jgi:hypothetical protein
MPNRRHDAPLPSSGYGFLSGRICATTGPRQEGHPPQLIKYNPNRQLVVVIYAISIITP